jgi:hypothetical protein
MNKKEIVDRKEMIDRKEIVEWRWSTGQPYEKSARRVYKQESQFSSQIQYDDDSGQMPQLAFQQALLSENDVWSLEEQQVFVNQDKPTNRREDTYNKMAEREMMGQIGMSPFVNRNYLEDVMVQEQFLKPMSTSLEKES